MEGHKCRVVNVFDLSIRGDFVSLVNELTLFRSWAIGQ